MNAKHTPGPWGISGKEERDLGTLSPGFLEISSAHDVCWIAKVQIHTPEGEANARLIAAAPELLEALKAVVAIADRSTDEFDRARAAIAKAEGKS
jgi:hypothetical protein